MSACDSTRCADPCTCGLVARAVATRNFSDALVGSGDGYAVSVMSGSRVHGVVLRVQRPGMSEGTCAECHDRQFPLAPGVPFVAAIEAARESAWGVARAHGHVVLFSTTEPGRRTMLNRVGGR